MMYQHTIKSSVSLTGVGAHSGKQTTLTLLPASENHGIVFKRIDLPEGKNVIPALWSYVTDTKFCTTISNNHQASVATIEHLMAALAAKKIDNVLIHINGSEVPILDGSAKPFLRAFEESGTLQQESYRHYLKILNPVTVSHQDVWAEIQPHSSRFTLTYTFRNRATNAFENYKSQDVLTDFGNDLSSARTFGFLEDVQKLYDAGLAKGSSLENAVVFDQKKVLNPEGLRFPDECARHKSLDVVGDLYLAGMPMIGSFEGYCSGHSINNTLLKKLLSDRSAWTIVSENPVKRMQAPIHQTKSLTHQRPTRFGT